MATTRNSVNKDVKNFYKVTNAEAKAFSAEVKRIYGKVFNKATRGITRANYIERLGFIAQGMREMGMDKELADLKKVFATQYKEAEAIYRESLNVPKNEPTFGLGKEEVAALINIRTQYVEDSIFGKIPEIQTVIQGQILTGEVNWDYLDNLADDYGGQSETILKTAMSSFYRTVNVGIARNAGLDLFLYDGPEDAKNRDFCFDLLQRDPPIYTFDEIKEMDNGQDLDVFTSGGGWNCRHQWRGLDLETAKELGYEDEGDAD